MILYKIPLYLNEKVVKVVTGGVDVSTELLRHRFDHILYTVQISI